VRNKGSVLGGFLMISALKPSSPGDFALLCVLTISVSFALVKGESSAPYT
jgi:hypothetical protein